MVQLLSSHLSIQLSLLLPWWHVVLLLVGSLGMIRLTVGMICVLSLLMYFNCCQYYKSTKLSIELNYCQVVPHQVNDNMRCHHQR